MHEAFAGFIPGLQEQHSARTRCGTGKPSDTVAALTGFRVGVSPAAPSFFSPPCRWCLIRSYICPELKRRT